MASNQDINNFCKESFKQCCITGEDLRTILHRSEFAKRHRQALDEFCARSFPSNKCRGCDKQILEIGDVAIWTSYWWSYFFPSHKSCLDAGMKREAFLCQEVDADCNDCRHFQRGARIADGVISGQCLRFNKPTKAYPNFSTGHECFEHRRSE
jgi:hypothetical protein